ncbi:homeobox domain-containing protein [Podospora appendiculata]|uniref:Homeobox domain-containing protein n=1 Tax=Podospora appendiculata TaxID=314037 RepID=A0AAE0XMD8_9PEZI|nr:homeobox domain-containing protein [Podospora appendiculata]
MNMGNEASREHLPVPKPGHAGRSRRPSRDETPRPLVHDRGLMRPHSGDANPRTRGFLQSFEKQAALTEQEVDILERSFAENPKPDSQRKRQLAKQLSIETMRISNWFQNRRAKEKQMRKTLEFKRRKVLAGDSDDNTGGEAALKAKFLADFGARHTRVRDFGKPGQPN